MRKTIKKNHQEVMTKIEQVERKKKRNSSRTSQKE